MCGFVLRRGVAGRVLAYSSADQRAGPRARGHRRAADQQWVGRDVRRDAHVRV